ncbi:hypothetical protein BC831DRAFT_453163 [Entophlyctis helioformis]|nr:hypothetical protein BC831DRAFT_453163 [Entophlyctis helioformis]
MDPARSVLVAVRIHRINQQDKSVPVDVSSLRRLVQQSAAYARQTAIAYPQPDSVLERALLDAFESTDAVRLLPVPEWGSFVPALNALVHHAAHGGFKHILFQSVEAVCTEACMSAMLSIMDNSADTLVVGKAMQGHRFVAGSQQRLDGVTTPWNTLALWSVAKLSLTGFLMVAEGTLPGIDGGVEEVSTIAVLQRLLTPQGARAVLLGMPLQERNGSQDSSAGGWDTDWADEGRRAWHEKKMRSKVARPAAHLALLQLDTFEALVDHIQLP